jgi:hypothetical protein
MDPNRRTAEGCIQDFGSSAPNRGDLAHWPRNACQAGCARGSEVCPDVCAHRPKSGGIALSPAGHPLHDVSKFVRNCRCPSTRC